MRIWSRMVIYICLYRHSFFFTKLSMKISLHYTIFFCLCQVFKVKKSLDPVLAFDIEKVTSFCMVHNMEVGTHQRVCAATTQRERNKCKKSKKCKKRKDHLPTWIIKEPTVAEEGVYAPRPARRRQRDKRSAMLTAPATTLPLQWYICHIRNGKICTIRMMRLQTERFLSSLINRLRQAKEEADRDVKRS